MTNKNIDELKEDTHQNEYLLFLFELRQLFYKYWPESTSYHEYTDQSGSFCTGHSALQSGSRLQAGLHHESG